MLKPMCLSEAQANELDECEHLSHSQLYRKGKRAHQASRPAVRAQGPLLPILLLPGTIESDHHLLGRGHRYML